MKTSKRFGAGMFAGAMVAALAAGVGLWRATVWAELGLSDAIFVQIQNVTAIDLDLYTPDAVVPATLPVALVTQVRTESVRGAVVDDITSVVTALGGTLNTGTGEISGERQKVTAQLLNADVISSEYLAIIDLKNLEFSATRGAPEQIASDVIRTVAIVEGYYTGRTISDIVEGDSIPVDVTISDSATIDGDGNGIPDADALAGGDFYLLSANGVITLVKNINSGTIMRGSDTAVLSHVYESALGPVEVSVEAPTLEAMQIADDSFLAYNTARLIVSISGDARDLVDSPANADPVSEFDLVDGTDPLPAPRNVFVRATIAVTLLKPRGTAVPWTFVDQLPGGLDFIATISGPGIASALQDGTDVAAYTYGVTLTQSDQDIEAAAGNDVQSEPWAEVDGGVILNNENSADDAADARIVTADDGDDTIRATFSIASAIFGSNITPRVAGGGDGDGSNSFCFIATAAYGTPMAKQIGSLRGVRDQYLIGNPLGAAFVDTYYRLSPPIADVVSESPALRQGVRMVLAPVVAISGWLLASPGSVAAACIAAMLMGMAAATRRGRRQYETSTKK